MTAGCAVVAVAAMPALASAAAAAPTPSSSLSPRVGVADTHPSWATSSTQVAKVPASKNVRARVYLGSRDQAGLDKAVLAVSTPGSPNYGKYLSPEQFRAAYGPTPAMIGRVTSWLRDAGLSVSSPKLNNRYVEVNGTVGAAQKAFGTGFAYYRKGTAGTFQAPATSVSVPRALAADVLSVTGLDESPARVTPKTTTGATLAEPRENPQAPQALAKAKAPVQIYPYGFRNAGPCSSYFGEKRATTLPKYQDAVKPYVVCGYTPNQLRTAYQVPKGLTGKGVTVAVIDPYLSPTLLADVNRYSKAHGVAPFKAGQFRAIVPAAGYTDRDACDAPGWSGEQTLDVEALHGMAPDAKFVYVAGSSCSSLDLGYAEAVTVDANLASIVSISYGGTEATMTTGEAALETQIFKQGALQGIGFYIASGDNGDEVDNTGLKQVDTSGSNPYATAVGGTSLGLGPSSGYWFETGWGTLKRDLSANKKSWLSPVFYGGAGGGVSQLFSKPGYQSGFVGGNARGVPDVGMLADPNTGMLIGVTQQFSNGVKYDEYRVGGTSLAAPLFAGVQALASEAQGGRRLGFANPRIYKLARTKPAVFHDIDGSNDFIANVRVDYADGESSRYGVLTSLRTFDDDSSLSTRKGWDPVTGVGSPAAAYYSATGN